MWVDQKNYQLVGKVLIRARERSGLTQEDVADSLKKPQSFVSSYERGQRRIDVLELLLIAKALGGDPVQLFDEIAASASKGKRAARSG